MSTLPKHKRKVIFYVPGMISLLLLPVLAAGWIHWDERFHPPHAVTLSYPIKDTRAIRFPQRTFHDFELKGDGGDPNVLSRIQKCAETMMRYRDTLAGIRVRLGDGIKYKDFMCLVDICIREKVQAYGDFGNDFLMLYIPPFKPTVEKKSKPDLPLMTCGTGQLMWEQEQLRREKAEMEEYNADFEAALREFAPAILFLLLLICSGVCRLYKSSNYMDFVVPPRPTAKG
jgi:hypothetical protein